MIFFPTPNIRHTLKIALLIITLLLLGTKLFGNSVTLLFAQSVQVIPSVETDSFNGSGDIADDSTIWVNPSNPALSVVIGDNKSNASGGLGVFDLSGKMIQFRQDGYIGNVDLRNNITYNGQPITLVGANHRGNSTIVLYKLNPTTRQLEPISGNRPTLSPNYGFCFYKSKQSGKLYAFVTQNGGANMEQYELTANGTSINSTKVRTVVIGSQSEGCVADDELGYLYVGEEAKALWKYNAEPSGGSTRTAVDTVGSSGKLIADVEGVTLAYGVNDTGYIFVSNQGNSTFNVYRREGNNAYVKTFKIDANGAIDITTSTDGIDVVNANVGTAFPKGLFVAHDASNSGGNTSNLKFIPLQLIVEMNPSVSLTIQPSTPIPTGTTQLDLTLFLHGLGKAGDNVTPGLVGNMNPLHPTRTLSLTLTDANNTSLPPLQGIVNFDTASGSYTGRVSLGTIQSGLYQISMKTSQYLGKIYPGIQTITSNQTIKLPPLAVTAGDTNNDNSLSILDYNMILDCFSDLGQPRNCSDVTKKQMSDITDDGNVNQFDYNLFLRELSVQSGDGGITPAPTILPTNQPSPTATGIPTNIPTVPQPTTPPNSVYRAFSSNSYWNTPMPANAPIDLNSARYIADSQNTSHTQNFLGFTAAPGNTQAFGQPIYWASSNDKLYTITDGTRTVKVHIPNNARPATGSDGQITIYDLSTDQVVGMSVASYNSSTDQWTVGGSIDRYILSSNGLDTKVTGSNNTNNTGHRGITTSVRAVRVNEVKSGVINHRLACFWWATGTQTTNHYWPMAGDEGAKGGIVPEGIVIRIKPSVNLAAKGLSAPALVIAKALQQYGCMAGDNSGSGNRLKLELNESAWRDMGLTYDALSPLPWSDWEFIKGGYDPVSGKVL